ncbi:MAG: sulfatase [Candidatus Nanoarchaeia archaeon]|nr:sulfatase [Candidatus Nanoarchaeia archaeon]MDD5741449.1 sulfatase [Candidatus Nanoarchaeia archaeon]
MNTLTKNVIIIVIDALRPKNLSLFGYDKETDKNLIRISNNGILFRNHFSAANSTAPSVTSILTGKYPKNHGIIHQLPYTKEEEIQKFEKRKFWLPEFLKINGYTTIGIDWIGLWFKEGFDYYGEGEVSDETDAPFKSAENITSLALLKIRDTKKPFFLFLHYWDTHFPFPHVKYEEQGDEKDIQNTLNSITNESQREYLKKRIQGKSLYTIQGMKDKYDLSITDVDKQIGRIYNFLGEKDLLQDTIIFILGDHGVNLTEHGIYFSPSGLYDDSIHSPLIAHIPDFEKKEIDSFVQNIDIVPTILDYLNLKSDEKFDGKSLIPLIKNNLPLRDKIITFDGLCEDIKAVRTKNKKLIIAKNNFCNLCKSTHHKNIEEYDLEKDPGEINNIFSGKSELMKDLA